MRKSGLILIGWFFLLFVSTLSAAQNTLLEPTRTPLKNGKKFFSLATPVPVQVKVTVANVNWVETISVCNISSNPIPLTNVEFNFNYALAMPTNIWGIPWLTWKLVQQQGSAVVLTGGTPWLPPLPPDPTCSNPLTIQFSAAPTSPAPTGPFVFKAEGGTPSGFGVITLNLSAAPANGLPNPQVSVQGMGALFQQVVNWGGQWKLNNLVPGAYTISATSVNNGQQFFKANPINVTVQDNQTVHELIQYQLVPSGQVIITLVNAPASQEPVTLAGNNYTIKQNVNTGTVLTVPEDTYTVTSLVSGFSAIANPNPLIVPTHNALNITYQPALNPFFVGYFQSWSPDSQTMDGTKTNLANLPNYVNIVNLAFMKPDAIYQKNSLDLTNTGLQFNYNGSVLKQAINSLHQRNPLTKILISVGGSSYPNWSNLNMQAIANFVQDFGLDGVDIDFEPLNPGCAPSNGQISCQIDAAFQSFVQGLRAMLPRPFLITVAGWSVGAYGQDQWANAQPQSPYTGMMLALFRSVAAKDIDMVHVMSFDAGNTYDPTLALAAYTHYFTNGPISMGVEVPPEASGGHIYTLCQVNQLTQAVKTSAARTNIPAAMMLWSIQKLPNGSATPTNPNATMMATTICTTLGLSNCNQPLLINGFARK